MYLGFGEWAKFMAHFAQLDENNIVQQVIVVDNRDTADASGVEKEYIGAAFCEKILGGVWKQTSYNANFRKNFASIGYYYDAQRDAFIPPKPFTSWILNEQSCLWEAPTPYPTDGGSYYWDEPTLSWQPVT